MFARHRLTMSLALICLVSMIALAGDGYTFKCAEKKCGYAPMVIFGGGMMFDRAMGWCDQCKDFRSVQWTRPDAPALDPNAKPTPKPAPVARIWVASLGQSRSVYKCPGCKEGHFMEILKADELTHCPKCTKPGFRIDPDAPALAVD